MSKRKRKSQSSQIDLTPEVRQIIEQLRAIEQIEVGNSMVKYSSTAWKIVRRPELFPHALKIITASDYRARAARHSEAPKWHLMKVTRKGKERGEFHFLLGEEALKSPGGTQQRVDLARYSWDYLGVLTMNALARARNGSVPQSVIVQASHPPSAHRYLSALQSSINGTWEFEIPGIGKIATRVALTIPVDEIVGGVMNIELNPQGLAYDIDIPILGGGPTAVLDIGGGTVDQVALDVSGTPDVENASSRPIGGNQAVENFRQAFAAKYPEIMQGMGLSDLPYQAAYKVLQDPEKVYVRAGKRFDCRDIFEEAFAPLVSNVREYVRTYTNDFSGFENALITGGVASMILPELRAEVFGAFDDRKIFLVERDPNLMVTGNASGSLRMARGILAMVLGEIDNE